MSYFDEYLTEKSLGLFLLRFQKEIIHNRNLTVEDFTFRPDYVIKDIKLVVEFNGYHHYTNPSQILKDKKKRIILEQNNFTFVEIPYFVQLDEIVIKLLFSKFNIDTSKFNSYPHGFIDKNALLPASFCTLGVKRFYNDLEYFINVKDDILRCFRTLEESGKDILEILP